MRPLKGIFSSFKLTWAKMHIRIINATKALHILLPIWPVVVNEEGVSASPSGMTEYRICSVVQ